MGFWRRKFSYLHRRTGWILSAEGTLALNSGGHGADIGNDTVFTLTVPAGRTTVSFGICAYGSSMAVVKANGQIIAEDLPLNGALEDGAETSVSYTSDAEAVITVEVTGNGYIHHISAETITPPRTAVVSGSVSRGFRIRRFGGRADPSVYG